MQKYRELWKELGVDLELHEELMKELSDLHEKTHLSQKNRPGAMKRFDRFLHDSHGKRVEQIKKYRDGGGKSIGTFCIYIPDEIAFAADVLAIPLCGGSGWAVSHADKMLPRDICPLVRSTFGMSMSGTCPYKKLKDFAVGETTCDAKKKAWDLFGFKVLEVPQKKENRDRELWLSEVHDFRKMMENLSGTRVTEKKLKDSIMLMNRKRTLLEEINLFRKSENPPISGLDALLVSQAALGMDVAEFIDAAAQLLSELEIRAGQDISSYRQPGKRILMAGSPSPLGNAKVHYIVESSGLRIVADESCTGIRYYRDKVKENGEDVNEMIEAIADRYFSIDCSCFSPNTERINNLLKIVDEYRIDGVVQNILQYCQTYNIEARRIEKELKKVNIPSITIETDYSSEDIGQIRTRIEAFAEMLEER